MDLRRLETKTTAKGESSKLMEEMKPMEEYSAVSTSLAKRKAESEPAEESSDDYVDSEEVNEESGDDGYVNPDDELLKATWWTAPEWGEDSFEGHEYRSSEEDELSDKEQEKNWRSYKRMVMASKGFYVEPGLRPPYCFSGIIPVGDMELPAGHGQTYREYFAEMACLCLQKYNQEKGLNVEFVQVVRGNYTTGSRSKSYITFMAREKPHGPLVEYQAKVWCTFVKGENYPILCRPAPPQKPPSNQNQ